MYFTVVTEQKSAFLRHGLTYASDEDIPLGTLVEVPLRSQSATGVVIASAKDRPSGDMDVKPITAILRRKAVLSPSHVQTLLWMCEYYCCTARHALGAFLPSPPWSYAAKEASPVLEMKESRDVKGKKQKSVIDFLQQNGPTEIRELRVRTGASVATIKALLSNNVIGKTQKQEKAKEKKFARLTLPHDEDLDDIEEEKKPTLLFDERNFLSRLDTYANLAARQWNAGKSTLLLFPNIYASVQAEEHLRALLPEAMFVLHHSKISEGKRRAIFFETLERERPTIVIGTRSALFTPVHNLGLIVLDQEHEWTWKSEQTPRYHARLTAEVLAKNAGAKLVLSSATPSLDSLRHALPGAEGQPRYSLVQRGAAQKSNVRLVDLTQANFGAIYPFTGLLVERLEKQLQKKEASVLLLNRRGTATGILCYDCKRSLISDTTKLPLSMITRNGAPWLLDKSTGEMHPVPTVCPSCQSTELKPVGAGTERVEEIVRNLFPDATVVRADADTLDQPKKMGQILQALEAGNIDILLGTQSVLAALRSYRVTLAGVLIADVGLSLPDFRAGERVFQMLCTVMKMMEERGEVIVQTFRPEAPEIRLAVEGKPLEYLQQELKLRTDVNYPPYTQLIDLIIRNDKSLALRTFDIAKRNAISAGCSATMTEDHGKRSFVWTIRLRGIRVREVLSSIPLGGIVVNVDPID